MQSFTRRDIDKLPECCTTAFPPILFLTIGLNRDSCNLLPITSFRRMGNDHVTCLTKEVLDELEDRIINVPYSTGKYLVEKSVRDATIETATKRVKECRCK